MKNLFSSNSILVFIIYFSLNPELTFSQVQTDSFIFEGVLRDYIVFLPQNYNGVDKLPLVFNLHGGSLNAQQQLDYSKMNEVADTAGFIVVYPNAVFTAWSCGINLTAGHVNDVGFIDALIDTLANNYSIDEERIYCCGFSLGGFMSQRLACELSNRIAAIADVAGSIAQDFTTNSTTAHPIPVLKFHGTADQIIPYDGKNDYCSVQQTLTHWANFNHCNLPDTTLLFNIDTLDGCTVQKIKYTFYQDSGEVVHYKVLNGGHSWPGGDTAYFTHLSVGLIGNTSMDINASELIWDFFKNYNLTDLYPVRVTNLFLEKTYVKVNTDSILFRIRISNIKNLQFTLHLIYSNQDGIEVDSIKLYDDGLHTDSLSNDGLYGAYIPPQSSEDFYSLKGSMTENLTQNYHPIYFYKNCKFTTTGPVIVDSLYSALQQTQSRFAFRPYLRNLGATSQINNPSVKIICNDSMVTNISPDNLFASPMLPGQRVVCGGATSIYYDPSKVKDTLSFNIRFEISSDGINYWNMDTTISFVLTETEEELLASFTFCLEQNYPNPFNPTTRIGYVLQEKSNAKLTILNSIGEEIAILVNEEQDKGYHKVEFDGSKLSSGVYFYSLRSGSFVQTRKMILLK